MFPCRLPDRERCPRGGGPAAWRDLRVQSFSHERSWDGPTQQTLRAADHHQRTR